ncbi:2-methoxy-6-polyprenyl-1,4-benzoquinol methylase, mitochondrial isoform X2 [Battus philenor]|uniref:2-methoxy-6-polyprenyl-1,4-benzoquinol methylase, mitochondrial isoform X2 n=1 Tax=Battus philenor TaxID=42288 RepID=UPI0035D00115
MSIIRRNIFRLLQTQNVSHNSCNVCYLSMKTKVTDETDRNKQTHFGFKTVNEEEKWKKVHEVFETVAEKYDIMNDVMSLGIHRVWKDIFIHRLAPTHGTKLLDVAGGTGDISFRYINYLKNSGPAPENKQSKVTVYDINQAMLDVGQLRAQRQGYTKEKTGVDVEWMCGDAEKLSLPDDSFTAYTIAFGVRNCTHIEKVLEEAYRVLAPGGRFMCLEFSQLPNSGMQCYFSGFTTSIHFK